MHILVDKIAIYSIQLVLLKIKVPSMLFRILTPSICVKMYFATFFGLDDDKYAQFEQLSHFGSHKSNYTYFATFFGLDDDKYAQFEQLSHFGSHKINSCTVFVYFFAFMVVNI